MSRSELFRQGIDAMNARDFTAAGTNFADNVKFHAPGIGLDVEGRDELLKNIGEFVQQANVSYEVEQVIEHGPFLVAFARSTGDFDGERKGWDLCQVLRYEGEQVAEAWVLRGGDPQPTSS